MPSARAVVSGITLGRWAALAAIAGAAVFIAALVTVSVGALDRGSVDAHADAAAHSAVLTHAALLSLARGVTNLGAPVVVDTIAALSALVLWVTGHRRAAVYLLAVRVVAQVIDTSVKVLVGRARPQLAHPVAHATGYSFPSGHATGAASTYLPLAVLAYVLLTRKALRGLALTLAVLVCLVVAASRVLLGVHYPSDVLAGLALGITVTAVMTPIVRGEREPA